VDALPLTPAGKVDRRALTDDRRQGMAPAAAHVAPRTPTEQALAEIWGTVLGRAQVGVEDDFFELGGHSLLAAMVAARIRQSLHVTLPLRRVFEHTTVAALAAHVDAVRGEAARPAGPTLSRVARTGRRVAAVDDGIIKRV
ncbi:MAG TPA: phosphopantetheine-binding protein, partial [Longimicrobiaceae bacterium]|nr:phosphopantetheine-binding protein [Longimicrobiaceae bacterium]